MFCFILEGEISSTTSLWATCAARVVALASGPLLIMSLRSSPRLLFPQLPSTTARVVRARPRRVRTRVVAIVAAVTTVTAQQVLPYRGRARGEKNSYEDPKIHLLRSFSSASISTSPSFLGSSDGFQAASTSRSFLGCPSMGFGIAGTTTSEGFVVAGPFGAACVNLSSGASCLSLSSCPLARQV